jgi:hypothetical protein
MKKNFLLLVLLMLTIAWQSATAQQRRPIDSQHPLWLIHIDVWNSADPQKIIDLIPADIKPYVCMNLSLSCQFDTNTSMYRMPRNAVRTYKSWASVCQLNNMWFSCQPASGGHTHIQDNDLETFEYFFKTYPNFLGWNYAEQFWAFGDAGDMSSMTAASRWALFANLVEMSHKYGGFLTVSWCGGDYHMNTNPMGELKADKNFLAACKKYPEAIVFLYKYTHASSFYNNESICWGPFISGLAKNYGVRYDNCGWNDTTKKLVGENKCTYPGSAGIGTVMEQTCVNGGAVWDGPELIWTEDFKNLNNTTVNGYTRRNWGRFDNFNGIWLDMWRRIIDGTMYIPTREEVVNKTKIAVINDFSSGYESYTSWDDLYNGLYLQTDPFNQRKESRHNYGQWYNNLCYFKSTGRYGAIPIVIDMYDDIAKSIPIKVKRSNYQSRWSDEATKQADFNEQYPEVSTGDLYVNRYRNQLVTYTPYSYLNSKKTATADIPLLYNTCEKMNLTYGKLSSGVIREYEDHINFYLNNYRSDTTNAVVDKIVIYGVKATPSYTMTMPTTGANSQKATIIFKRYDSAKKTYTVWVSHLGPVLLSIKCTGEGTDRMTDVLPADTLALPKQPEPFKGPIIIEAENMDYKNVNVALTHSGWWAQEYKDFAAMGYVETYENANSSLRHSLKLTEGGDYNIRVRYCNSNKAGSMKATINGTDYAMNFEKVDINDWREAVITTTLNAGENTLILQNSDLIKMTIDQIIYEPAGTPQEKFNVKVRDADFGHVVADVDSAVAGQTVHLTITPEDGYGIKALKVVSSIFFTQGKTIPVEKGATEASFVMPDDNVTIQPVFYDMAAVYELDFTNVANGAHPIGWRTNDGSNRDYPSSGNTSGPRTFAGLIGYQGKALYWRTNYAEYGRLTNYKLNLQPGKYQLIYVTAAWKGAPTYQANILNSSGTSIKSSVVHTAKPNIEGNAAGDISSAVRNTLDFEVTTKGNYIIQFKESGSGMQEFLLAECRIRDLSQVTGITTVHATSRWPQGIYSPAGVHRKSLQHGLNIVVDADGNTKKVMIR